MFMGDLFLVYHIKNYRRKSYLTLIPLQRRQDDLLILLMENSS